MVKRLRGWDTTRRIPSELRHGTTGRECLGNFLPIPIRACSRAQIRRRRGSSQLSGWPTRHERYLGEPGEGKRNRRCRRFAQIPYRGRDSVCQCAICVNLRNLRFTLLRNCRSAGSDAANGGVQAAPKALQFTAQRLAEECAQSEPTAGRFSLIRIGDQGRPGRWGHMRSGLWPRGFVVANHFVESDGATISPMDCTSPPETPKIPTKAFHLAAQGLREARALPWGTGERKGNRRCRRFAQIPHRGARPGLPMRDLRQSA
jgi:hypothetical protein